jgi:large subunit ribosomal protein L22
MEFKVVSKYLRVSPRKVRPVIRTLRGRTVDEAMSLMSFTVRGSSRDIFKALKSARANALLKNPDIKKLWVSRIVADAGPQLKRWKAISRGRASKILKRTSHLTVVLTDAAPGGQK